MKRILLAIGDWMIDFGFTIRETAKAISHIRKHPADLDNK